MDSLIRSSVKVLWQSQLNSKTTSTTADGCEGVFFLRTAIFDLESVLFGVMGSWTFWCVGVVFFLLEFDWVL